MKKKILLSIWLICIMTLSLPLPGSARVVIEEVGESIFPSHFMPAEGNVNALVIPVEFIDFRFEENPVDKLEDIFNGSGLDLVPSVAEYLSQASYGKMQFSAQIQPVVRLSGTRGSYSGNHTALIQDLLAAVAKRGVDLNDFDQNQDGVMDGLYIIWAGAAQGAASDWWPYSDTFYFDYSTSGIRIGSFSSLSYQLMTEGSRLRQYTAIHETGHQLGLTDYYASSYAGGTGATIMMDRNEGDEDCFSKMLLGWVTPQVVTASSYITLRSASTQADAVLIAPSSWNGNYLSEYFMAEYVTPEANQSNLTLSAGGGVRVWHVNAATSQWTDEITASMYRYDNSGDGPKLLSIVDETQQWYGSGEGVTEEQTLLYTGEESGIAITVESIENGQATLCVRYFGEEPAKPETPSQPVLEQSQETDEASDGEETASDPVSDSETQETENAGSDGEISENENPGSGSETQEGENPGSEPEENATEEEPGSEPSVSGETENAAKKGLPNPAHVFPVLFLIGLGILIYLLLSGGKKRKYKGRRKRK